MKWRLLTVVIFIFILLFCGCGQKKSMEVSSDREKIKTADELISEAEEREKKEKNQSESQVENLRLEGEFVCAVEYVDQAFYPMLILDGNGKALFKANLLTGMGEIQANYTVTDLSVKLAVTKVGFDGFSGEKTTEMVFNLLSENELELAYITPDSVVGITQSGDKFVRTK